MKDISSLLQKFKNFGLKEHTIKDSFLEILKEKLKLDLTRKDLELKDNKLRVNCSGSSKTEIILKKTLLLNELNNKIIETGTEIRDIL